MTGSLSQVPIRMRVALKALDESKHGELVECVVAVATFFGVV